MSKRWRVLATYRDHEIGTRLSSLSAVFACEGAVVSADPISRTIRFGTGRHRYYAKVYHAAGKGIRRYLGSSKISKEWKNLLTLQRLGIPGAEIVAYGEERRLGVFRRGALVTAEIESALNLMVLAATRAEFFDRAQWVAAVQEQLAGITSRMHGAGFTHGDLHWRNVLVTTEGSPRVYLIDCPAGRRWLWPLLSGRLIKDLANLDAGARGILSSSRRLAFFLCYRGVSRLRPEDKRMIARIQYYNRRRRRASTGS